MRHFGWFLAGFLAAMLFLRLAVATADAQTVAVMFGSQAGVIKAIAVSSTGQVNVTIQ